MRRMNAKQKNAARTIDALLARAIDHGKALIESEARRILRGDNPAKSFCMGMGTASFYDRNGNPLDDNHPAFQSFYAFLYEYNCYLYLTGIPVKIDGPDAPTLTDW